MSCRRNRALGLSRRTSGLQRQVLDQLEGDALGGGEHAEASDPGISVGGMQTLAPSSAALRAAASMSLALKKVAQCGGTSFISGGHCSMPPT